MNTVNRRDELQASIDAISANPSLSTYLIRGAALRDGVVSKISVTADIGNTITSDVLKYATRVVDREFIPYDPAYQLASNQVLIDDVSSIDAVSKIETAMASDDIKTDTGHDQTPVLAMVHRLESIGAEAITAYRLKGAGIATRRAKGLLAMLPNGGVFSEVRDEILFYEPHFDALVCDTFLLVSSTTTLSRNLESPDRARATAKAVFAKATANIAISGGEQLLVAVQSDPAMIAKMMSISRLLDADPSYADLLTTKKLVDFLSKNPQIEIEIEGTGRNAKLVFDPTPQKRYRIVKTLADDYLNSALSGRDYEAGSKQQL
jgi:hypothetical protein